MKRSMKNWYCVVVMMTVTPPCIAGIFGGKSLGELEHERNESLARSRATVAQCTAAMQTSTAATSSSATTVAPQPKPAATKPAVVAAPKKPSYVWPMAGITVGGMMAAAYKWMRKGK